MSKTFRYIKLFFIFSTQNNPKIFSECFRIFSEVYCHIVLSDEAEFAYKCTDFYRPGDEGGLLWNDENIGIEWPISSDMELNISEKDKKWLGLKDTFCFE